MNERVKTRLKYLAVEKWLVYFIVTITILLLIFSDETLFIKKEVSAKYFLIFYAICSLIALGINGKKLIIVMFGATGVLALFLKITLDSQVYFPPSNHTEQLDIKLINLDQLNGSDEMVLNFVEALNADLILYHGYTPDWRSRLGNALSTNQNGTFVSLERIDLFGMSLISTIPIKSIDTLEFEDIPILRVSLNLNQYDEVQIFNFLLPPGLTQRFKEKQRSFIDQLAQVASDNYATLFIGNFNLTPWADNLQYLKSKVDAKCSRVNKSRLNVVQENPFDYNPTMHILYNRKFQNIFFDELDFNSSPVGVSASYQVKI